MLVIVIGCWGSCEDLNSRWIQTKNRSVCENAVTVIWGSCRLLVKACSQGLSSYREAVRWETLGTRLLLALTVEHRPMATSVLHRLLSWASTSLPSAFQVWPDFLFSYNEETSMFLYTRFFQVNCIHTGLFFIYYNVLVFGQKIWRELKVPDTLLNDLFRYKSVWTEYI